MVNKSGKEPNPLIAVRTNLATVNPESGSDRRAARSLHDLSAPVSRSASDDRFARRGTFAPDERIAPEAKLMARVARHIEGSRSDTSKDRGTARKARV